MGKKNIQENLFAQFFSGDKKLSSPVASSQNCNKLLFSDTQTTPPPRLNSSVETYIFCYIPKNFPIHFYHIKDRHMHGFFTRRPSHGPSKRGSLELRKVDRSLVSQPRWLAARGRAAMAATPRWPRDPLRWLGTSRHARESSHGPLCPGPSPLAGCSSHRLSF